MKREDLKPCPFCGGVAELKQTGRMQITIKCKTCNVKLVQAVIMFSFEWLEDKIIETWNTRSKT